MEAAKESIKKFTSKSGHHDTTLHEKVAPSVQKETISQTQHERQTTAVDREIHQDHFHTSEQPVQHSEVLPEQHHHKAVPVEKREFEHDDHSKVQRGLDDERKQYYDTQTRVEGEKTRTENPTVQGEHVHHHVHETIQPVVSKQTVEPHVVHTTVPVHEVHHNQAHHHAASALPPIGMDEYKNKGGALGGEQEKNTFFPEGQPRSIRGHDVQEHCATDPADGPVSSNRPTGAANHRVGVDSHPTPHIGSDRKGLNDHVGTDGPIDSTSSPTSSSTQKKPSLIDKINPKKDADGDGKPGFMK